MEEFDRLSHGVDTGAGPLRITKAPSPLLLHPRDEGLDVPLGVFEQCGQKLRGLEMGGMVTAFVKIYMVAKLRHHEGERECQRF